MPSYWNMCALALCLSCVWSASAAAQTEVEEAEVGWSANVELVSDYRFRGVSLSDRKPAFQAGVEYVHGSGLFAGGWASTIADDDGADVEVDLYAGYSGSIAAVEYSVTATRYVYPKASGLDYFELQSEVVAPLGPVEYSCELAFTPDQKNASENIYAAAGLSYEGPHEITFHIKAGWEDGAYPSKWDYELGIAGSIGDFSLRAAYVATNRRAAGLGDEGRPAFIFGAGLGF